jgi:hypothetical protein
MPSNALGGVFMPQGYGGSPPLKGSLWEGRMPFGSQVAQGFCTD